MGLDIFGIDIAFAGIVVLTFTACIAVLLAAGRTTSSAGHMPRSEVLKRLKRLA